MEARPKVKTPAGKKFRSRFQCHSRNPRTADQIRRFDFQESKGGGMDGAGLDESDAGGEPGGGFDGVAGSV
jgi:hypothetical protein